MGLSDSGRDIALDAIGDVATLVSLHTADPGTTGASEVAGGSPAYARQTCVWADAAGGSMSLSAGELFDVPGGISVTHFGTWTADGTTFIGGGPLDAPEDFAGQGTFELTDATISIT